METRGAHCSVTPEVAALLCFERGHGNPFLVLAQHSPHDEHEGINEQLWHTRLSQVHSGLRADWLPKLDASGTRSPIGSGDSIKNKAELKSFVDSTPWERIVLYCLRFGLRDVTFHTVGLLFVGFPFH